MYRLKKLNCDCSKCKKRIEVEFFKIIDFNYPDPNEIPKS